MNSIFVFDFTEKQANQRTKRTAVIFCSEAKPRLDASDYVIREFFDQAVPPDEICFLVSGSLCDEELRQIQGDKKLRDVLPSQIRDKDSQIKILTFDQSGTMWEFGLNSSKRTKVQQAKSTRIKTEGLQEIFCKRHGILEASSTHHYAKPSGKHCNQFVRTANVLNSSSEINFIAFCLLPHISDEITHIYCDTASIHALAYAVSYLKSHFPEVKSDFIIDSFGSYEGLDSFHFQSARSSIVLISASTSGDLVEKVMKADKSIDQSRIITLFYLSRKDPKYTTLCKLIKCDSNPRGFEAIENQDADNCELCNQGSVCIKIVGDQFLPENPNASDHLIRATDAPKWLSDFLQEFREQKVIKCHYNNQGVTEKSSDEIREIYLDVADLYQNGKRPTQGEPGVKTDFFKRWNKIMEQSVPASLRRIIYLDDKASYNLAQLVSKHFISRQENATEAKIELKSANSYRKFKKEDVLDEGTTIIVCGCMCTGRKLMSVSQSLRSIQTNGAILFLIGMSRTPDKVTFDEIKSNLTFGDVPSDYGFQCVQVIQCRDNHSQTNTSWQDETAYLSELQMMDSEAEVRATLNARKQELEGAVASRGLTDNVFWSNALGSQMQLRPNMAFVNFSYKEGEVSQAEVYFAISSILHKLRDSSQKQAPLTQYEHHRVVLSPQCFYRYNDGVIQAALLRAATRSELDYSISQKYSEQMHDVLTYIFDNWDNQVGEATIEFLIALGTKKLKLRPIELAMLLQLLNDKPDTPPFIEFLCDRLTTQLLSESNFSLANTQLQELGK